MPILWLHAPRSPSLLTQFWSMENTEKAAASTPAKNATVVFLKFSGNLVVLSNDRQLLLLPTYAGVQFSRCWPGFFQAIDASFQAINLAHDSALVFVMLANC